MWFISRVDISEYVISTQNQADACTYTYSPGILVSFLRNIFQHDFFVLQLFATGIKFVDFDYTPFAASNMLNVMGRGLSLGDGCGCAGFKVGDITVAVCPSPEVVDSVILGRQSCGP